MEDLTRMASGYGYRTDPFTKIRKFHYGMDFTALVELLFMLVVMVLLSAPILDHLGTESTYELIMEVDMAT